ncbi:RNA-binding domain-containing protein [Pannonibacter sp. Pt2-lr]
MEISRERLRDLLVAPREDLDFEVKNWLNLQGSNDDKATLAKAILALANHGGGFIVLGLTEADDGVREAEGRPATLDGYNQDLINGIVQYYCDPPFHCAVHIIPNPAGAMFPIVVVPGGHRCQFGPVERGRTEIQSRTMRSMSASRAPAARCRKARKTGMTCWLDASAIDAMRCSIR